jgi:amino acid transporter
MTGGHNGRNGRLQPCRDRAVAGAVGATGNPVGGRWNDDLSLPSGFLGRFLKRSMPRSRRVHLAVVAFLRRTRKDPMIWSSPDLRPSRMVRIVAWAGVVALLPYMALKSYWAMGGTAGIPAGFDMADEFAKNGAPSALVWMERHGLDFTAILALGGALLLMTLTWSMGMRMPRRLLLVSAWLGALLFLPYGLLTALVAVIGGNDSDAPELTGWLTAAGVLAFCGVGAALAVCARSFQRRSGADRPAAQQPVDR